MVVKKINEKKAKCTFLLFCFQWQWRQVRRNVISIRLILRAQRFCPCSMTGNSCRLPTRGGMVDVGGASRDGVRWRQGFNLSGELCKVRDVDTEVTEGLKDIG